MSGIAGILRLDGAPADRAALERMTQRLAHRGPDGTALWNAGPCGLGHLMLCGTPESREERLPLANSTGDLVVTADARIDNRAELMSALGLGSQAAPITDGELIVHAYERWGERCPERLTGDFAFAIWDGRRQALFCARDHVGVKPFYYHHRPGRFVAFASEIKGLLAVPEVPRRLNEIRVAEHLLPLLEDKAITFYEEIVRLPPAHRMTVTRDGVSLEPYWALDPDRELRLGSDGEYAEAFRDILTESVRCRLRSAYPVGSQLSGGLDSSAIVCVARRLFAENGGKTLHTFSAVFDEVPECDERRYIEAVLGGGGVEPHYMRGDRLSPLGDIDRVLEHQEEPFLAPNLFLYWESCRLAKEHGVRVILDGLDGDATVSHGFVYLAELARAGEWSGFLREVKGLSTRLVMSQATVIRRYALAALAPQPLRWAWRTVKGTNALGWGADSMVCPQLAQRANLKAREAVLQNGRHPPRSARQAHWRGLTSGLIPSALEITDKAAAAFGLEPRHPFFDRRLVEFCLALPGDQKLRDGWTRAIERRALADVLPEEIRWRGKTNLTAQFLRALRIFEQDRLHQLLVTEPAPLRGFVDMRRLRTVYRDYELRGARDSAYKVWQAATLALWLRHCAFAP